MSVRGVTIGARLFAVVDGEVRAVQILDRAPERAWWASLEAKRPPGESLDENPTTARPEVVAIPARHLHPSRSAAESALATGARK